MLTCQSVSPLQNSVICSRVQRAWHKTGKAWQLHGLHVQSGKEMAKTVLSPPSPLLTIIHHQLFSSFLSCHISHSQWSQLLVYRLFVLQHLHQMMKSSLSPPLPCSQVHKLHVKHHINSKHYLLDSISTSRSDLETHLCIYLPPLSKTNDRFLNYSK